MGAGVRKQDQKEEAGVGRPGSRLEEVLEGGREALLSLVVEFGLEGVWRDASGGSGASVWPSARAQRVPARRTAMAGSPAD